jgi:hypothetical protein
MSNLIAQGGTMRSSRIKSFLAGQRETNVDIMGACAHGFVFKRLKPRYLLQLPIPSVCMPEMPTVYAHHFVKCRPYEIQLIRRVRGYVSSLRQCTKESNTDPNGKEDIIKAKTTQGRHDVGPPVMKGMNKNELPGGKRSKKCEERTTNKAVIPLVS